jgi:hypothetical protein
MLERGREESERIPKTYRIEMSPPSIPFIYNDKESTFGPSSRTRKETIQHNASLPHLALYVLYNC